MKRLKAFEKAEKSGYNSNQVKLQKAGILRLKGDVAQARSVLKEVENQASHNPEYHFQTASCFLQEGVRDKAITHFEKAVELDPSHTGALFQLGHSNDLAGNDDEAIGFYERCMNHPPLHMGLLMNLGILYEDSDKYDKAVDCYRRILHADPNHEQAKLFLKDAEASLTQYYNPEAEAASQPIQPGAGNPGHRFRAVGAQPQLPEEDEHPHARRSDARQRAATLEQQEFRRDLAQRDQADSDGAKGLRVGQALEQGSTIERRYVPTTAAQRGGTSGAEQAGQRFEPVGPGPQVHEPPGHRQPRRIDPAHAPTNCSKRRISA